MCILYQLSHREALSSGTRDQTHDSCIDRWILYQWAAREALSEVSQANRRPVWGQRQRQKHPLILSREWPSGEVGACSRARRRLTDGGRGLLGREPCQLWREEAGFSWGGPSCAAPATEPGTAKPLRRHLELQSCVRPLHLLTELTFQSGHLAPGALLWRAWCGASAHGTPWARDVRLNAEEGNRSDTQILFLSLGTVNGPSWFFLLFSH